MSFDDSLLDDPVALRRADPLLREVATSGSRVRVEAAHAEAVLAGLDVERPRAVIAVGAEARLLRAVLEPTCPVPFVAWPHEYLPAWVGPLDVVVVLGAEAQSPGLAAVTAEAARRGARLLVAAPEGSEVAAARGRGVTLVPTTTGDSFAAAVAMLGALRALGLGPDVDAERVAMACDQVAERCAPPVDLAQNPAKGLAVALADHTPLVWGGTILAARASRRVAEALREASGLPALAADADHLLPLLAAAAPVDRFADPDDDVARPSLLLLVDADQGPDRAAAQARLEGTAESHDVRVTVVRRADGGPLERYAALLVQGRWAAEYIRLGLGRS